MEAGAGCMMGSHRDKVESGWRVGGMVRVRGMGWRVGGGWVEGGWSDESQRDGVEGGWRVGGGWVVW